MACVFAHRSAWLWAIYFYGPPSAHHNGDGPLTKCSQGPRIGWSGPEWTPGQVNPRTRDHEPNNCRVKLLSSCALQRLKVLAIRQNTMVIQIRAWSGCSSSLCSLLSQSLVGFVELKNKKIGKQYTDVTRRQIVGNLLILKVRLKLCWCRQSLGPLWK